MVSSLTEQRRSGGSGLVLLSLGLSLVIRHHQCSKKDMRGSIGMLVQMHLGHFTMYKGPHPIPIINNVLPTTT